MPRVYLEFEKPIQKLEARLNKLRSHGDEPSKERIQEITKLEGDLDALIGKIYSKLTRWQRVQVARHPERPYSLNYIQSWSPDFIELHGDRYHSDDTAVVSGMGTINGHSVVYIGQQKGRNTKENLHRNFGMMHPEGYRKAFRLMKLAEKFGLPVVTLIDTPGAYPGIGAEERGQAEAIASNLLEMSRLRVPIIAIVIGEGASGGALGIGICDRMLMLENTWYSVISPEGCASILWRDVSKAPEAAEALKVTPQDLVEMKVCDRIVPEPPGGAHRDVQSMIQTLKEALIEELDSLEDVAPESFLERRIQKYDAQGVFAESK